MADRPLAATRIDRNARRAGATARAFWLERRTPG
jgi:hypothetical protein